jgi:hypothetical protein
MRSSLALALLAGCASASSQGVTDSPAGPSADAKIYLDSSNVEQPPDAAIDAPRPIDAAPPMPDAAACTPHTTQLLGNPAFDLSPMGTRWTEQPYDSTLPIITNDPGLNPQSSPYRAWMGGLQGVDYGVSSITDQLYQDITVPAGTTQLVLTGYYAVATSETGSTVYDTGSVDLIDTSGTPIEPIASLTNATIASSWTQLSHTFTTDVSGQTVRLRFTTTNDSTNPTSFYFDTLSLKATHCP